MRNYSTLFLVISALTAMSLPAAVANAGYENGNAGDVFAIEFKLTARDIAQRLRLLPKGDLQGVSLKKLANAIISTTVSTDDHVFLDGFEVNAKNYPDEGKIVLNRNWWAGVRVSTETINRLRLVLHEYLPLIDVPDEGAKVSERLIALLDIKNYNPKVWWSPLNPANHLTLKLDGGTEDCQIPSVDFNLAESEENFAVETFGTCTDEEFRIVQVHKSSYNAPPSTGFHGTVHLFEFTVINKFNVVVGKMAVRPQIAECLAPDEGTCALGGNIYFGGLNFQFWLLRDSGL